MELIRATLSSYRACTWTPYFQKYSEKAYTSLHAAPTKETHNPTDHVIVCTIHRGQSPAPLW